MSENAGAGVPGEARPPHPDSELEWVTETPEQRTAAYWGLVLLYGVLALLLGVALAVWPDRTVVVVAVLVAFQLVIYGSTQLFVAIASTSLHGTPRFITALIGVLAIVAGVLCFAVPLQNLTFTGSVLGSWLVLAGIAELALALVSQETAHRVWDAARGLLGLLVGLVLLLNPHRSLDLVVVTVCVWLIGSGLLSVVAAFVLRSRHRADLAA